jgi:hypothetical protein
MDDKGKTLKMLIEGRSSSVLKSRNMNGRKRRNRGNLTRGYQGLGRQTPVTNDMRSWTSKPQAVEKSCYDRLLLEACH